SRGATSRIRYRTAPAARLLPAGTEAKRMRTMPILDGSGFASQAEALSEPLYRFMRSRGAGADEAMDLVQETLLRAFRARGALREPALFRAWIYGIGRNVLADARRAPAFRRRALDEA